MLYKFRNPIDFSNQDKCKTSSIFKDKSLWFSNSALFNDPYEGVFQWDKSNRNEGEGINNTTSFSSRSKFLMNLSNSFEASRNGISQTVIDLSFLCSGALQLPGVIDSAESYLENLINIKVKPTLHALCLFKQCKDIVLWSHYGSNHEGMALGFSDDIYNNLIKRNINYQSEYKKIGYLDVDIFNLSEELIFRKSSEWVHEDEVRIVLFPINGYNWAGRSKNSNLSLEVNDFWARAKKYIDRYPNRKLPTEEDAISIERDFWDTQWEAIEEEFSKKIKSLQFGSSWYGTKLSFERKDYLKRVIFGVKMSDQDCRLHINFIRKCGFKPKFYKCFLNPHSYSILLSNIS